MKISKNRIHTFFCSTARWFGLESRATLNNKTGEDCRVGVELFDGNGEKLSESSSIALIRDQESEFFNLSDLERYLTGEKSSEERIFNFFFIPTQFVSTEEPIELEPADCFTRLGKQDHYIEHFDPETGFSSGVLYQTVPMNSALFASTYSFLLVAPKIFLSEQRNTAFLLLFYSPDENPPVEKKATVHFKLRAESGEEIAYWHEEVPRGGLRYVDIKAALTKLDIDPLSVTNKHGFVHCEAFCDHASFIELTMNFNSETRTFDLEHSLPPIYYNLDIQKERRKALVEYYSKHFKPECDVPFGHSAPVKQKGIPTMSYGTSGRISQLLSSHPKHDQLERCAKAHNLLKMLIAVDDCFLEQFDFSYIDTLPQILREMHGFQEDGSGGGAYEQMILAQLKSVLQLSPDTPLSALAPALRELGIREEEFRGRRATTSTKTEQRYDQVAIWGDAEGVTVKDSVDKVNKLQIEYSLQSGGNQQFEFTELGRPETGDVWTSRMQQWIRDGLVTAEEPAMTIGPRWASEITYFRETIGLRGTIGLDLFSNDSELVEVGDMHDMPFEDNTFGLVYQRNTFNKSYDLRKAIDECVRVLRPGGIFASDDCMAYTDGVSEIARANVTRLEWYLRYLGDYVDEVLLFNEAVPKADWIKVVGQIAVKIKK
ncbi:class I SAM-dependent methyltransferase [bacterium]|nr:class I SAM-dependent methyltransferase [bacterium]